MKLILRRIAFRNDYTIGRLYVKDEETSKFNAQSSMFKVQSPMFKVHSPRFNAQSICDTLEPRSAHVSNNDNGQLIAERKHEFGKIAIPTGTYKIRLSWSRKFSKLMPFLEGVKGFEGVMIHPGNYPRDTLGCILPGWNRRQGMVCASITAFSLVMQHINAAIDNDEDIMITVRER